MATERKTKIRVVWSDSTAPRLVRSYSDAQALQHVVADTFGVAVPAQDQLFALASRGVKIEDANAPQAQAAGEPEGEAGNASDIDEEAEAQA